MINPAAIEVSLEDVGGLDHIIEDVSDGRPALGAGVWDWDWILGWELGPGAGGC